MRRTADLMAFALCACLAFVACSSNTKPTASSSPAPLTPSVSSQSSAALSSSAPSSSPNGPPPHVFVFMLLDPSADPRLGWPQDPTKPLAGQFYDCSIQSYVPVASQDTIKELAFKDCVETYEFAMTVKSLKSNYPALDIGEVVQARYGRATVDSAALTQALSRDPKLAADPQAQAEVLTRLKVSPAMLHVRTLNTVPRTFIVKPAIPTATHS